MATTLLLTDVVDSTKMSEALGDTAMASLWEAHDRLARDLLVAHGGLEIDKTDGFLLIFDSPAAGVAYARDYHRALSTLSPPMSARAGLHVADVILRENPAADVSRGAKPIEVEGIGKNVAARVMSVALGGQTLASPAAIAALEPQAGVEQLSHGHWRLKGVFEPVELFEVGVRGEAPFIPPPDGAKVWRVQHTGEHWIPVREVPRALPSERDAFVGRTHHLAELARLFDDGARLVSVLGTGGSGKSRLAIHYGWSWLGDWPGGVWFCDLSEARDQDGIVAAVADVLAVPVGTGDSVRQLGEAMVGRGRSLLILDNFEQVAAWAEQTVGAWLDHAAQTTFLVTTREILGLPGEHALPLPSLRQNEAVELFNARARAASPRYREVPEHVEELVRLLDALPLAIELAAARVVMLSPKKLLDRIGDRFRLLTSKRGRRDRQATLRATIDWSWNLLDPVEQTGMAQLSVFEGGFALEAAEEVLDVGDAWPSDIVQSLIDKSLVRVVDGDRMDLLVSVQLYAAEKLAESDGRDSAERRHAHHYLGEYDRESREALEGPEGGRFFGELLSERENLLVMHMRAAGAGDLRNATLSLAALWPIYHLRGPLDPFIRLAEQLLAASSLAMADRAVVLHLQGNALLLARRHAEAADQLSAAVTASRQAGDARQELAALVQLANAKNELGALEESVALVRQSIEVAERLGDQTQLVLAQAALVSRGPGATDAETARVMVESAAFMRSEDRVRQEAYLLTTAASCFRRTGQLAAARESLGRSVEVFVRLGDRQGELTARVALANLAMASGDREETSALNGELVRLAGEVGALLHMGIGIGNLGLVQDHGGQQNEAEASYRKAISVFAAIGAPRLEAIMMGNLGQLQRRRGRTAEASDLLCRALHLHREVGFQYGQGYWLFGLGLLAAAREDWDLADQLSTEAVVVADAFPVVLADTLAARARVCLAMGDLPEARRAIDRAMTLDNLGRQTRLVAVTDAIVALAEGSSTDAALLALDEAEADSRWAMPGSEVAELVAMGRELASR